MKTLADLRTLADAATPGPWQWSLDSGSLHLHHGDVSEDHIMSVDICRHCYEHPPSDPGAHWCTAGRKPDHDYIAACSPEVIKALVAVAEAAEAYRVPPAELSDSLKRVRSGDLDEANVWAAARVFSDTLAALDALKAVLG